MGKITNSFYNCLALDYGLLDGRIRTVLCALLLYLAFIGNRKMRKGFIWHRRLTVSFLSDIKLNQGNSIEDFDFEKTSGKFQGTYKSIFRKNDEAHGALLIYETNDNSHITVATFTTDFK